MEAEVPATNAYAETVIVCSQKQFHSNCFKGEGKKTRAILSFLFCLVQDSRYHSSFQVESEISGIWYVPLFGFIDLYFPLVGCVRSGAGIFYYGLLADGIRIAIFFMCCYFKFSPPGFFEESNYFTLEDVNSFSTVDDYNVSHPHQK
ncbi:hypothetical protein V6N13_024265 [Hibiscus sabdariffa]